MTPQRPERTCRCGHRAIRPRGTRGNKRRQKTGDGQMSSRFSSPTGKVTYGSVRWLCLMLSINKTPEWMIKAALCIFIKASGDCEALCWVPRNLSSGQPTLFLFCSTWQEEQGNIAFRNDILAKHLPVVSHDILAYREMWPGDPRVLCIPVFHTCSRHYKAAREMKWS